MKKNKLPFFFNKEILTFINDFEKLKNGKFRKLKSTLHCIENVELVCKKNSELYLMLIFF